MKCCPRAGVHRVAKNRFRLERKPEPERCKHWRRRAAFGQWADSGLTTLPAAPVAGKRSKASKIQQVKMAWTHEKLVSADGKVSRKVWLRKVSNARKGAEEKSWRGIGSRGWPSPASATRMRLIRMKSTPRRSAQWVALDWRLIFFRAVCDRCLRRKKANAGHFGNGEEAVLRRLFLSRGKWVAGDPEVCPLSPPSAVVH